ncbi:hypothetical protein B0T16DRAFT_462167 [Cercophora newfieldiana]|uniref:Uncharacterized protein n=1 Tax=Cercophora newfieldiana TaxID=92897 RepID=A0AA39XZF8_9PEZI|nr:hypothetical protein B0T16DRAFT_462167 [Cercophora newfieldiana]
MSAEILEQFLKDDNIDFDPTRPSISVTAQAGHPFSVPWGRQVRCILAGLDSSRFKDAAGPWMAETPFDADKALLGVVIPDALGDGGLSTSGHYRDALSTSSSSNYDHLSASLGVEIGYPCLSASVTAKYNKTVTEDKNGVKASRNSSCRAGRVILDRTPVLSAQAISILRSEDGEAKFRSRFGDFYICGFALGADAGACMSASTESMTSEESLEITVKVKALFFEVEATYTETWSSASQSASISFSGYSTLDPSPEPCSLTLASGASPDDASYARNQQIIRDRATLYLAKVSTLQKQVWESLQHLGLTHGAKLGLSDCTKLCRSGLVAELLLAPYARLNQYVECVGK